MGKCAHFLFVAPETRCPTGGEDMELAALVETTVAGLGYELVDFERSNRSKLLRVFIDLSPAQAAQRSGRKKAGAMISVEDCEAVSRQLSYAFTVENIDYDRLEVSSPGLDRPLKTAADFARFAGQQVNLTLRMPFKGRKRFSGTLLARQGVDAGVGGWRLLLDEPGADASGSPVKGKAKAAAAADVDRALDFQLDEVREARLVPVLDFKGRRFLPAAPAGADEPAAVDGGRER